MCLLKHFSFLFYISLIWLSLLVSCVKQQLLNFCWITQITNLTLKFLNVFLKVYLCYTWCTCLQDWHVQKYLGILYTVVHLYKVRALDKAQNIQADLSQPLCREFLLLLSGRMYNFPRCRTNRFKPSFVPDTTGFLNNSLWFYMVCITLTVGPFVY